MSSYKVVVDEFNPKTLKIVWFDDEGNEIQPEPGLYKVKVNKGAIKWTGDNISCFGSEDNDYIEYTYIVKSMPPKPIVEVVATSDTITFLFQNNSAFDKRLEVGSYMSFGHLSDTISYNKEIVDYITNVSEKSISFVLKKTDEVNGGEVYIFAIPADTIYNKGIGMIYENTKVYNDYVEYKLIGTPKPALKSYSSHVDVDNEKVYVTIVLDKYSEDMVYDSYATEISTQPYLVVNGSNVEPVATTHIAGSREFEYEFDLRGQFEYICTSEEWYPVVVNTQMILPNGMVSNIGDNIIYHGKACADEIVVPVYHKIIDKAVAPLIEVLKGDNLGEFKWSVAFYNHDPYMNTVIPVNTEEWLECYWQSEDGTTKTDCSNLITTAYTTTNADNIFNVQLTTTPENYNKPTSGRYIIRVKEGCVYNYGDGVHYETTRVYDENIAPRTIYLSPINLGTISKNSVTVSEYKDDYLIVYTKMVELSFMSAYPEFNLEFVKVLRNGVEIARGKSIDYNYGDIHETKIYLDKKVDNFYGCVVTIDYARFVGDMLSTVGSINIPHYSQNI